MTDIFVSRQPILDAKQVVEGYELLYPSSETDATLATARVVLDALGEIGLEHLVGQSRAWINITSEFVSRDLVLSLPSERVVLELDAERCAPLERSSSSTSCAMRDTRSRSIISVSRPSSSRSSRP